MKIKKRRIPIAAQVALVVAGGLLVAFLGYLLLIGPQRSQASALEGQIADTQQRIDQNRLAVLEGKSRPEIKSADLFRLSKAMPDRADMSGVLLELNRIAADTGITFTSISPQTSVPISGYQAIPIALSFEGTFFNLSDFLYRLRTLVSVEDGRLAATGRLFDIDTLEFAESPEGFPQITATLVVDAFVYGTGVPATATPTAPTGTTATTPGATTTPTTTTPEAPPLPAAMSAPVSP